MYPPNYQTYVTVEEVTKYLEGASRPGHFRGVATVVAKLFNIVGAERAYFGQKDAQQTIVIKRMVQDLNMPIDIIICPTQREADGLALSSRNTYLDAEHRRAAPVLYRALNAAKDAFDQASGMAIACDRSCGTSSQPSHWRNSITFRRRMRHVAGVGSPPLTPAPAPVKKEREYYCRWRCAWVSRG